MRPAESTRWPWLHPQHHPERQRRAASPWRGRWYGMRMCGRCGMRMCCGPCGRPRGGGATGSARSGGGILLAGAAVAGCGCAAAECPEGASAELCACQVTGMPTAVLVAPLRGARERRRRVSWGAARFSRIGGCRSRPRIWGSYQPPASPPAGAGGDPPPRGRPSKALPATTGVLAHSAADPTDPPQAPRPSGCPHRRSGSPPRPSGRLHPWPGSPPRPSGRLQPRPGSSPRPSQPSGPAPGDGL
jgi:hypothetical protein